MTQVATETATRRRNRDRILDAAVELLSSGEALTKLSINRIASTAGMSRATFYLHFKSKRDLVSALAQRGTGPWIQASAPALQVGKITRAEMTRIAQGAIDMYRSNRGVLSGIIEMAEYDKETREAWRETIKSIAILFQAGIERWRPQLSKAKSAQLAWLIVWGGERFLHQEVRESDPGDDELLVWTLTEMAWQLMRS